MFCNVVCTCIPVNVVHTSTVNMWDSIRFHCVPLTSCAVGQHSTFESNTERPWESNSLSVGEREQRQGTEQCRLPKGVLSFCDHLLVFARACTPVITFKTQGNVKCDPAVLSNCPVWSYWGVTVLHVRIVWYVFVQTVYIRVLGEALQT